VWSYGSGYLLKLDELMENDVLYSKGLFRHRLLF
jgi:hypothetical protein